MMWREEKIIKYYKQEKPAPRMRLAFPLGKRKSTKNYMGN